MKEGRRRKGMKERKQGRKAGGEKSKGKEKKKNKSGATYWKQSWLFRIFVKEPQFN